jgi:hypothetical protein
MSLAPRRLLPARPAATVWVAAIVLWPALSLAAVASRPRRGDDTALSPRTVVAHLLRALPAGAHDVRINALYGSGHSGTWEFVAHLTWRDSSRTLAGGRTELPRAAGQFLLPTALPHSRLLSEHALGWTPDRLAEAARRMPAAAPLAMIELASPATGEPLSLTRCWRRNRADYCVGAEGDVPSPAALQDDPGMGPLSVRRSSPARAASSTRPA